MAADNTKVVILGATGMLGSMVLNYFSADNSLSLVATARNRQLVDRLACKLPVVDWKVLDAEHCDVENVCEILMDSNWAVNAIGVIKPYIHDENAPEVERAVKVNAIFPHVLAQAAEKTSCRILQIATDCVYSGIKGAYVESDKHDAWDIYGKTKSLGEVYSPNVFHLRCSIIGPEPKAHVSLLDWFLGQARGAKVNGFSNHKWNGISTLHFGKLCLGVIKSGMNLPHLQHVVPTGMVTKDELLQVFGQEFGHKDITVARTNAKTAIDRTLVTENKSMNQDLWRAAGHAEPPSVLEMVAELARFDYQMKGI